MNRIVTLSLAFGLSGALMQATTLLLVPGDELYQQTTANPCVFGGDNCQNGTFPQGSVSQASLNNETYSDTMIYSGADYALFQAIVGNSFIIGVDVNDTSTTQYLKSFTITFSEGTTYTFSALDPGAPIPSLSNGEGFSDYLLISSTDDGNILVPVAATSVTFEVNATVNDGSDRFFLISRSEQGEDTVPEPSSLALLGLGLVVIGYKRIKR